MFADSYARSFYPQMTETANVRAWIEWNLDNYAKYGFGLWGIELRQGAVLIGDCGLTYQDVEGRDVLEIGYHITARERGKGYATEAAHACLDFGFRHTASDFIGSIVRPWNPASCTVAGRVHAGCREFVRKGEPALLFYTTRDDWERRARFGG
jgi:RimJ/RimL family protein N-acetyltransferase